MAHNNGKNKEEPNTAPRPDRWYNLTLGNSFNENSPSKFCTLRYEFKPASIDKSQPGSLHKTKDNRVMVEFHNNQPGKPNVSFEGSSEDYKDNDAVLFFDGETFRLERLHRAVKRLRHVRLPGESAGAPMSLAATSSMDAPSPPRGKGGKSSYQPYKNNLVPSAPQGHLEVERIDVGEPESPGPKFISREADNPPFGQPNISPPSQDMKLEEHLNKLFEDDDDSARTPEKVNTIEQDNTTEQDVDIGSDFDMPNQIEPDDEIADVDVSDDDDKGPNAAEALRAQVNAQGETSSSSGSSRSGSSGSSSGSGSSSSDSEASNDDSVNSI